MISYMANDRQNLPNILHPIMSITKKQDEQFNYSWKGINLSVSVCIGMINYKIQIPKQIKPIV